METPEEKLQKFYQGVLTDQHELCKGDHDIECLDPPPRQVHIDNVEERKKHKPIMITKPEILDQDCKKKTVRFEDNRDRCDIDQNDICDFKRDKTHCDCTQYKKCL